MREAEKKEEERKGRKDGGRFYFALATNLVRGAESKVKVRRPPAN